MLDRIGAWALDSFRTMSSEQVREHPSHRDRVRVSAGSGLGLFLLAIGRMLTLR